MARQPEGRRTKKIRTYLIGQSAVVYNIHGGDNPFQEVGIPDLLCCWRGLFIGLEVKLPGEEPSKVQLVNIEKIRRAGGIAEVVTSVEDVEDLLERLSRKGVI